MPKGLISRARYIAVASPSTSGFVAIITSFTPSCKKRDKSVICVVAYPKDVLAIEKGGAFEGVYHVLHGTLSPLDGRAVFCPTPGSEQNMPISFSILAGCLI